MTRYRKALKPNGVIFIKENTVNKHAYWVDQDDAYFIRSQEYQELTYVCVTSAARSAHTLLVLTWALLPLMKHQYKISIF